MSTTSFAHRRDSLRCIALLVLLATACDSKPQTLPLPAPSPTPAPNPAPTPSPAPTPEANQYAVSGVVLDAGSSTPIANARLMLRHAQGEMITRTDADGAYAFSFRTSQPFKPPRVTGDFLGQLIAGEGSFWGDERGGHWTTVQLLPWGPPDVRQNVRLRPVSTLSAGQGMNLSIEPDSSVVWDREWDPWAFPTFEALREEFFVSVQADGVLTVEARSEAGGNPATLTCTYIPCVNGRAQGTVSIPVEANWRPLYFSVEIPRASAPQRYEIQTSLR